MTRLALAKTLVTGTVTLQGVEFTFTGSGTGTATADSVKEAKAAATTASNSAAVIAARASINQILAENSAVLSDLEITSLISNNFTTTVVVYRPIALSSIASTTDGVNYTLKPNVTIGDDQVLTVPAGITLNVDAGNNLTNNGIFQIDGNFHIGVRAKSKTLKTDIVYDTSFTNTNTILVGSAATCTIDTGVTVTNSYNSTTYNTGNIVNYGTFSNYGSIVCSWNGSYVYNSGTFVNYSGANITCSYTGSSGAVNSYVQNDISDDDKPGTFTNYGSILCSGQYSYISNNAKFNNGSDTTSGATITCSGVNSYFKNDTSGTFTNNTNATIECSDFTTSTSSTNSKSYINNLGKINNSGTISCSGYSSYFTTVAFTNNGTITCSGYLSYFKTTDAFTNNGTITCSGSFSYLSTFAAFSNDGTITCSGDGTNSGSSSITIGILLNDGSTLTNNKNATITLSGAYAVINIYAATVTNKQNATITLFGKNSTVYLRKSTSTVTNSGSILCEGTNSYISNTYGGTFTNTSTGFSSCS